MYGWSPSRQSQCIINCILGVLLLYLADLLVLSLCYILTCNLFFFLSWICFSFRHKELSQGKLTFFAAGISSVLHPVRKCIVVVDERNVMHVRVLYHFMCLLLKLLNIMCTIRLNAAKFKFNINI